jgi:hypothetical protein
MAGELSIQNYIDAKLVHSLHTSVRKSFRSCRRRWNWAYIEKYYPRVTPAPLEFGVAFHAAMEYYYDPRTWHHDNIVKQGLALVRFKNVCEEQLRNYTKLNGEPETVILDEYKDRIKLGLNMLRYYTEHVSPFTDVGFTPIEVEVPFEIPIVNPDTNEVLKCKCSDCWKKYYAWIKKTNAVDLTAKWVTMSGVTRTLGDILDGGTHQAIKWEGLPVTYGGRLDMLAQDDLGRLWIYDWKTTSRIMDEDSESSFLTLDDQIASYVWALRLLGMPVVGFVYVEIKKAYPTTPDELSRLYKGRRFSTSKTLMTTPEIYRRFVSEYDAMAYAEGCYDDYLSWLKREGPKFHQRHQIHKNDHECEEVGRNIFLEARDIISSPAIYPQPGRFSCQTCLYRQPCIGKNQGEDYKYTLDSLFEKKERNYYDEQPSTEKSAN